MGNGGLGTIRLIEPLCATPMVASNAKRPYPNGGIEPMTSLLAVLPCTFRSFPTYVNGGEFVPSARPNTSLGKHSTESALNQFCVTHALCVAIRKPDSHSFQLAPKYRRRSPYKRPSYAGRKVRYEQ